MKENNFTGSLMSYLQATEPEKKKKHTEKTLYLKVCHNLSQFYVCHKVCIHHNLTRFSVLTYSVCKIFIQFLTAIGRGLPTDVVSQNKLKHSIKCPRLLGLKNPSECEMQKKKKF